MDDDNKILNSKKNSFQGADNKLGCHMYASTFEYIKNGDKILNLGCGKLFDFERELSRRKRVLISSVDIIPVEEKPGFVYQFFQKNIEEKFSLDESFNVVTFFEVIEHIDKTDVLLQNCYDNLKEGGRLIFSFPNLSSIWGRLELLMGCQPHILEVSNESASFGTGFWGRLNHDEHQIPIHHIRGITHKAMKEMIKFHGFEIEKTYGWQHRRNLAFFYWFPSLAPVNFFICKKIKKKK